VAETRSNILFHPLMLMWALILHTATPKGRVTIHIHKHSSTSYSVPLGTLKTRQISYTMLYSLESFKTLSQNNTVHNYPIKFGSCVQFVVCLCVQWIIRVYNFRLWVNGIRMLDHASEGRNNDVIIQSVNQSISESLFQFNTQCMLFYYKML
jgi:hypothetical protein